MVGKGQRNHLVDAGGEIGPRTERHKQLTAQGIDGVERIGAGHDGALGQSRQRARHIQAPSLVFQQHINAQAEQLRNFRLQARNILVRQPGQ